MRKIILRIDSNSAREIYVTVKKDMLRKHRQVYMVLGNGFWDPCINDCLKQIAKLWNMINVTLVGEPLNIKECMIVNAYAFNFLTELYLEFVMDQRWKKMRVQNVTMEQLKRFYYLQVYIGPHNFGILFRFSFPRLEGAYIVLDSLANEEVSYWEDPLIEIITCPQLKTLNIDLNSSMWETFFSEYRPELETLVLRRAKDEYEDRNWHDLFINMPNLRNAELHFTTDRMIASLGRYCQQLQSVHLGGFCLYDGSFTSNMNLPLLERVYMDGWNSGVLFTYGTELELPRLTHLNLRYIEFLNTQTTIQLDVPKLTHLTLRRCDYKKLRINVGNELRFLDVDYNKNPPIVPDFFYHLENVERLHLQIDESQPTLLPCLQYLSKVKFIELICQTETHPYDCNALFVLLCHSCPKLEELLILNEHENTLTLNYDSFAQMVHLENLRELTLQCLTLPDPGEVIRMDNLLLFNQWSCITGENRQYFPLVGDRLTITTEETALKWNTGDRYAY